MSHKHRRPSTISRIGRRPLHLGVAAGVAGTVAVTGTLVASAAPATPNAASSKATSKARQLAPVSLAASMTAMTEERATQRSVEQRNELRAQKAAEAKKRKAAAAKKRKAERAAARRAAERRAAEAREEETASRSSRSSGSDERMSRSAANVLSIAAAQSGDRYSYGAAGPDAFDCSGFTQYVFGKVGISLPHSSSAQRSVATRVSSPQPGDLVFVYNGGGGSIGHVAIYAGNGYWYEAANPSRPVGKYRAWSSNVSYGRVL